MTRPETIARLASLAPVRRSGRAHNDAHDEPSNDMPEDFFAEVEAGATPGQRPRLRVWTPEEIWAPLPKPEYAIGGLLLRANLALVVATGSSLKTWAMCDLAVAQGAGRPWLERFPVEVRGSALIFDWESGDYELRRRLQAISREPVAGVELVSMPELFFNSEDFESQITELAKTRALIALDSLAAGTVDVDENDARFAKGLQTLKRVGTVTGCSFVVLHHSRKSKADGSGDDRERPRGTGAIFAACDVVLQLDRADDGAFLVKQTKARSGKAVDPFVLRVADQQDGRVRVYATEPADATEEEPTVAVGSQLEKTKNRILVMLQRDHDIRSKNDIVRRLRGRKKIVLDALDELIERGHVVVVADRFRLATEVAP